MNNSSNPNNPAPPPRPANNGFTSSTPRNGYFVTAKAIRRIKKAVTFAAQKGAGFGVTWQSVAARPSTAEAFCVAVEADYPENGATVRF